MSEKISTVNNFTRNNVLMEQLFKITFDGAAALEYQEDAGVRVQG